jgi:hypothetical protein
MKKNQWVKNQLTAESIWQLQFATTPMQKDKILHSKVERLYLKGLFGGGGIEIVDKKKFLRQFFLPPWDWVAPFRI